MITLLTSGILIGPGGACPRAEAAPFGHFPSLRPLSDNAATVGEVRTQIVVENERTMANLDNRDCAASDQKVEARAADSDAHRGIPHGVRERQGCGHGLISVALLQFKPS